MDRSFWAVFKNHPVRDVLNRAAATGQVPDENELASISAPERTIDRVREQARMLADIGSSGYGGRGQQRARRAADAAAEQLIREIPRQYAHAAPEPEADDEPEPAALAAAIRQRQRYGITAAKGIDDR